MPSAVPNGRTKRFGTASPSVASRPAGWWRRSAAPAHAFARPPASSATAKTANDAAVAPADGLADRRGEADGQRADRQHQRRHAEQQADPAPDELKNSEQHEMRTHMALSGC